MSNDKDLTTEVAKEIAKQLPLKEAYRDLLALVEGKSITLEEYARRLIHDEVVHATEVDKMLRKPGDLSTFDSHSH